MYLQNQFEVCLFYAEEYKLINICAAFNFWKMIVIDTYSNKALCSMSKILQKQKIERLYFYHEFPG